MFMRLRWIFVLLAAVASLALFAACGGDSGPAASDEPDGEGPASLGLVAPDTFLTFEGQRYQLRAVLQADLIPDEFTEVGVASEADIDHEGELTVFRRRGEDAAVYTFSPAIDTDGEESDVPALWLRWEAVG
jgi:hypothetical protein